MNDSPDTAWVVEQANALGFDLCGVVRPEKFPELDLAQEWLSRGYAGGMRYLSDPRRCDPQSIMPALRSVIVCALNYNSPAPRSVDVLPLEHAEPCGWISRYAWGQDYHDVLQKMLHNLASRLSQRFTEKFQTRIYADTGPLHERVFANRAGLGWLGKNTLLLNSKLGSWFFLGVILTTLDLPPTLGPAELPPPDLCGSCTKCIDACPTGALVEPYVLDSRLCISYLTIELRGSIPIELREPMGSHVFGCDVCQDVCPWNRRAPVTQAEYFQPRGFSATAQNGPREIDSAAAAPRDGEESLLLPRLEWLASMSEEQFRAAFSGSPVKRTKWRGLLRNVCVALGNSAPTKSSQRETVSALLRRLSASPEPCIAESARWALSRIQ